MKTMILAAAVIVVGMGSAAFAEPARLNADQMDGVTAAGPMASITANTFVSVKDKGNRVVVKKNVSKHTKALKAPNSKHARALKAHKSKLNSALARLHARLQARLQDRFRVRLQDLLQARFQDKWKRLGAARTVKILGLH
jgi:hypothetical protein